MRCQSSESHKNNQIVAKSYVMEHGHKECNGMSKPICLVPSQKFHAVKRLGVSYIFRFVSATAWQSHRPGLGSLFPRALVRPDCCYCSSVDSVGLAAHRGWLAGTAPSGAQCAVDPEVAAYICRVLCADPISIYPAPRLPERNSNNVSVCTDSVRLQKINRIGQAAQLHR